MNDALSFDVSDALCIIRMNAFMSGKLLQPFTTARSILGSAGRKQEYRQRYQKRNCGCSGFWNLQQSLYFDVKRHNKWPCTVSVRLTNAKLILCKLDILPESKNSHKEVLLLPKILF